jgi:hypothetical protein
MVQKRSESHQPFVVLLTHLSPRDPTRRVRQNLVNISPTGMAGRPCIDLNPSCLHEVMSTKHHLTFRTLANILGIHHNTLRYKLRELGLEHRFSNLTNGDLDHVLKLYKHLRPDSGLRYTVGFLRRHGIKMQRQWVRDSLERIDGLGCALRRHDAIQRHKYRSHFSHSVGHIDGLHKLILWGYVIHGMVDGHDHMVVFSW